ncbi:hypothetical protein MACH09_10330 [Vibrio sp. MACH09]|uniref:hypothetical protein n=1 Tax=Vibrio sp. MACH09 TaxID=3025122 RepID=UPI00278FBEA1|nr:hypothetical protein [Vibrio sp. MACH09]GLO60525.1 hypothetical protein MACH09_10330 [Vibrio sp. MACH09]
MTNYTFPTLGEAAKIIFDSTGLLAQKNHQSNILKSESEKKSLQTKLRRLAKEEGDLDATVDELALYLMGLLTEATQDIRVSQALMDMFRDLYDSFRETMKDEGTYLSKKDTVKWLIEYQLSDLAIKSIQKYTLMHSLATSELSTPPTPNWWLPKISEGKVIWPIETALRWIYNSADIPQARFHNPSNNASGRASQNAENASRWLNRDRLPKWGELQENLDFSLSELKSCSEPTYHREFAERDIQSFRVILFLARMSTDIFKRIDNAFGIDFTKQLIFQMKAQNRRLWLFHQQIKRELTARQICEGIFDKIDVYRFWHSEVDLYWRMHADVWHTSALAFQKILNRKGNETFTLTELKELRQQFEPFFLAIALRPLKRTLNDDKKEYMELYFQGCKLRKHASREEIANFQSKIHEAGHSQSLKWLVEWMYATYCYRNKKHKSAYTHYKNAFDLAKHSIGRDTYLLVNQYAESCAKNDKWVEFKKAVTWACHKNIKIRWHRGFEDTEEAIKGSYQMLKIANYFQL